MGKIAHIVGMGYYNRNKIIGVIREKIFSIELTMHWCPCSIQPCQVLATLLDFGLPIQEHIHKLYDI